MLRELTSLGLLPGQVLAGVGRKASVKGPQIARVEGPGSLELDFGPPTLILQPTRAQKLAPEARPGERKHH